MTSSQLSAEATLLAALAGLTVQMASKASDAGSPALDQHLHAEVAVLRQENAGLRSKAAGFEATIATLRSDLSQAARGAETSAAEWQRRVERAEGEAADLKKLNEVQASIIAKLAEHGSKPAGAGADGGGGGGDGAPGAVVHVTDFAALLAQEMGSADALLKALHGQVGRLQAEVAAYAGERSGVARLCEETAARSEALAARAAGAEAALAAAQGAAAQLEVRLKASLAEAARGAAALEAERKAGE